MCPGIFASGNSPAHVDSEYVLFEKPDNWKKTDSGVRDTKSASKYLKLLLLKLLLYFLTSKM